jgi:6-phosphofructokinase 1
VQLIEEEKYGYMVALQPPDTIAVKITDAIGRLRTVKPDGDIVTSGRSLGISFGDERQL